MAQKRKTRIKIKVNLNAFYNLNNNLYHFNIKID